LSISMWLLATLATMYLVIFTAYLAGYTFHWAEVLGVTIIFLLLIISSWVIRRVKEK